VIPFESGVCRTQCLAGRRTDVRQVNNPGGRCSAREGEHFSPSCNFEQAGQTSDRSTTPVGSVQPVKGSTSCRRESFNRRARPTDVRQVNNPGGKCSAREGEHFSLLRDNRDLRDLRDIRDPRDLGDFRDLRDNRDLRDFRDLRDLRDLRDIRDFRDPETSENPETTSQEHNILCPLDSVNPTQQCAWRNNKTTTQVNCRWTNVSVRTDVDHLHGYVISRWTAACIALHWTSASAAAQVNNHR